MVNVVVDTSICEYINNYWYNNIIIDQSKYQEKLNIKYEIEIDIDCNETRKKCNDIRDTDINKSNYSRKYTENNSRERYRKQDSNNRINDEKKSCEHRIFQKCSNTNKNKGKMYDLSEKCRLHEHEFRERKVLLDSFSKPKLTSKEKLK
jgi:hypothetical protein